MTLLSASSAFKKLKTFSDQKSPLTAERISTDLISHDVLKLSFAGYRFSEEVIEAFQSLSEQQACISKYKALLSGECANKSEGLAVKHHALRSLNANAFSDHQVSANRFAHAVRSKQALGHTNQPFTHIVQIGIGGSELGPLALYDGLKYWAALTQKTVLQGHFISNIDPDHCLEVLETVALEKTLFIVVSKSGNTVETVENSALIHKILRQKGWRSEDIKSHFVAVTTQGSLLDNKQNFREVFYLSPEIGGRYSSTSVVGGVLLSLCFGPEVFQEILKGAGQMDQAALEPKVRKNATLMAAMMTIWDRNIKGCASKAIIPYSQALHFFPDHLQQLSCESNGKRVSIDKLPLDYETGPLIFGGPGTNSQHSFFQKIHQGTDEVPIQMIGVTTSASQGEAYPEEIAEQIQKNQRELWTNLAAQMVALSVGQDHEDPNKQFSGYRSVSAVLIPKITPYTLGALLAFYENVTMFESFLWDINAFDQEGVQLGKTLVKTASQKEGLHLPLLTQYLDLLSKE